MILPDQQIEARLLGNVPPLRVNMTRGLPDRRRISKRWLSGLILAGVTSLYLMGGALYAALDGGEQLTFPAQVYDSRSLAARVGKAVAAKGDRPGHDFNLVPSDNNIMMISTITKEGEKNIIKMRPFMVVKAPLAIVPKIALNYPQFDPLAIFAEGAAKDESVSVSSDAIYGEEVESEVAIITTQFNPDAPNVISTSGRSTEDIERLLRNTTPDIDEEPSNLKIEAENVSVVNKEDKAPVGRSWYEEDVKTVTSEIPYVDFLRNNGMDPTEANLIEKVLTNDLGEITTRIGDKYRLSFQMLRTDSDKPVRKIYRVSVYRGGAHLISVARSDDNRFVYSPTPAPLPQLMVNEKKPPVIASSNLPLAYDGIYNAAMSQGLPKALVAKLIRIMAFDVDFRATVTSRDELSVFISLEEGKQAPDENSEILFASIRLNNTLKRYYRFRDPKSGDIAYFDESGKRSRQFLLRKPVPTGKFKSSFGMRRHPISGIVKMHTGVDWAASIGTPIIAAGNGVVEKMGWDGGYGRQIIMKHANGYETTYNHMSRFVRGLKPGMRVRQGQIIGSVGSTGYSTGPHLHFEVLVNGRFVNPMRIRLPNEGALSNNALAAFEVERRRIDSLINKQPSDDKLASNEVSTLSDDGTAPTTTEDQTSPLIDDQINAPGDDQATD